MPTVLPVVSLPSGSRAAGSQGRRLPGLGEDHGSRRAPPGAQAVQQELLWHPSDRAPAGEIIVSVLLPRLHPGFGSLLHLRAEKAGPFNPCAEVFCFSPLVVLL